MMDNILASFLTQQLIEANDLVAASDSLELTPIGPEPVQRYLARFAAPTLVRNPHGEVCEAAGFAVGFFFPSDYLRRANPYEVATWLTPAEVFLPNVRPPFLCLGRVAPGTSLCDLLYQAFEIGTGAKVTMREDDALNAAACAWARHNLERFTFATRPLKRLAIDFDVAEQP